MEYADAVLRVRANCSSDIILDHLLEHFPILDSRSGRFLCMDIIIADDLVEDKYRDPEWVLSIDGLTEYTEYH